MHNRNSLLLNGFPEGKSSPSVHLILHLFLRSVQCPSKLTFGEWDSIDDEDLAAYLVGVDWIATTSLEDAKWQRGIFVSQQVVCKIYSVVAIDFLWGAFGRATKEMTFMAPFLASERSGEAI
jgi:hypothetical protein